VAGDFDGDGLTDVLAVSFLMEEGFPQRKAKNLDAVVLLHQAAPGRFERHTLEAATCDHVTCAAGDIFHRGRIDLVTGYFGSSRDADAITVWKNQTPPKRR
jgi:hypothetical protein